MRIMCLNGWGGKMHGPLLSYLSAQQPDVLCLQEVVSSPASDKDWLVYRDGDHVLDQRANFFRDICGALPDHAATFCPAAEGVLWDGNVSVPSQWGLATFVHRNLTVTAQIQGFVHKGFSGKGFGDHPRSRSAHGVRLFDRRRETMVSITQMHGLRDLAGKMDTPARTAQAQRLLAMSDQISEPNDLRILCGDFNVAAGSETLSLTRDAGFTELVTSGGFAGTRTSQYKKPERFADYMLVNRPEAVLSFEVVYQPEVSDHCPLVLEI